MNRNSIFQYAFWVVDWFISLVSNNTGDEMDNVVLFYRAFIIVHLFVCLFLFVFVWLVDW